MEHTLTIQKTVRYFTYGNPETAENIWIVLHGYSQLPEYFIKKFEDLDLNKNLIVAPEGMHRFYRTGTDGRVGASWMTKEARLDDIADNLNYLDQLSTIFLAERTFKNRILLGFSQGGATATRWHYKGDFKATHFILWASVFPPDVPFEVEGMTIMQSKNYFIVGKQDPYFQGHFNEIKDMFSQRSFKIEILEFEGKHDIDKSILLEIEEGL